MIWPSSLASTVLFRALHEPQNQTAANGWVVTRQYIVLHSGDSTLPSSELRAFIAGYRFFLYVVAGSFLWYWFPDYIWTGLSSFAFITWIWPNNQKVNALFGMSSGLGELPSAFYLHFSDNPVCDLF